MGEPAGVGGELTLKAWLRRGDGLPPFFAIDDPARLAAEARRLDVQVPLETIAAPAETAGAFGRALPVLPQPLAAAPEPGRPDPANADAVIAAVETAVRLSQAGAAAGIVTNPIQKAPLIEAGFGFAGHTDFLGHLAGPGHLPVMMLAIEGLRVVPVTVHTALRDIFGLLTPALIARTGKTLAAGLRQYFGIPAPRLAVAGLNPHAGEGGVFGDEEATILQPAIDRLRAEGIAVAGPLPPDSMFHADARRGYDAALCMYHDQALIPLKTLDFYGGVNVTLGLPFVRTSPDHGTALDIAGQGKANPTSFLAALRMAAEMAGAKATPAASCA